MGIKLAESDVSVVRRITSSGTRLPIFEAGMDPVDPDNIDTTSADPEDNYET